MCVCVCVRAFVCAQAALSSPSPSDGGPRQSPVWFGDSRWLAPGSQQPPGCQRHQTMLLSQGRLPNSPTAPGPNPSLPLRYPRSPWSARKSFFCKPWDAPPPPHTLCCGVPAGVAQPLPVQPRASAASCTGWWGGLAAKPSRKSRRGWRVRREPRSSVTPKAAFALSAPSQLCGDPVKPTLPGLPVPEPLGQRPSEILNGASVKFPFPSA